LHPQWSSSVIRQVGDLLEGQPLRIAVAAMKTLTRIAVLLGLPFSKAVLSSQHQTKPHISMASRDSKIVGSGGRHVLVVHHDKAFAGEDATGETHGRDQESAFHTGRGDATHSTEDGKIVSMSKDKANAIESMEEFTEQTLGSMVTALLLGEGPSTSDVVAAGSGKIDFNDAMKRLDNRLPANVVSLAHQVTAKKADKRGNFDEASLAKARGILNGMVESAQDELDAKIIECKEFESRNRGTIGQVNADLTRLGEEVADLERVRTEANQGIASKTKDIDDNEALLEAETQNYHLTKLQDEAEMTIRRNDLAVVQFVLELTKCPAGLIQQDASFLQHQHHAQIIPAQICNTNQGYQFNFENITLQTKFERLMTPNAKVMFHKTIARMLGSKHDQELLAQKTFVTDEVADDPDFSEDHDDGAEVAPQFNGEKLVPNIAAVVTNVDIAHNMQFKASQAPPVIPASAPVQDQPDLASQAKKCTDGTPNCGLLHDTMSLMWGKYKDLVDELQVEMDKKDSDFEELKNNMNQQIQMLGQAKSVFNQMLGEAISNMNAGGAETAQKEEQAHELETEYVKVMGSCKSKIEEILFTNICAVKKVRNTVMSYSSVSPPDQISDCDVSDWVPGACSVPCDDECPQADPYQCGGFQTLARETLVSPNEFGIKCPALELQRKCQQIKCPVNCVLSEWSGFSKCTKDCEGGVQGRSRSVVTKAANGGKSCDGVQESRPCNTGSCDRDCTLAEWTPWSPCSMACGGGLQERMKKVLVPIRGMGKCPSQTHPDRLEEQICNKQECIGDEVCIGNTDLIIAVDSSGSLRESGANALRDFASRYVMRLGGKYYGAEAMKVGIVQFGNGVIEADGTVAPAINSQPLTNDLVLAQNAIQALVWQKGFTNMAQALTLADTMLGRGGRSTAQSAILLITDSKPSFEFQTFQKVKELKGKGVKLFLAPVIAGEGKELDLMKKWASHPWETHLVHIPGVQALKADPDIFAAKSIATFCSKAISPSVQDAQETQLGFFLLKMGGSCGSRGAELGTGVVTPGDCKVLTELAGHTAFAFGKPGGMKQGDCFAENLPVTDAMIANWKVNRVDPQCPLGNWQDDTFYDFFVLEPTENL